MESLFDRNYKCQICENDFTSKQVKASAIRIKKRHKDFRAEFHGDNPTHYGVICCPYCGYAQFENDFKNKISKSDAILIQNNILAKWGYQNFSGVREIDDVIRVHQITLANYKVLGSSYNTLGKLYLRLAWFFEEKNNKTEALKYIEFSREAYISSYEKENYSESEERELEIIYLIGELSRQLALYNDAIKWFQKVLEHPVLYKNRLIKIYAKEQMLLSAQESKIQKRAIQSEKDSLV